MADERSWALAGRLLAFSLLMAACVGCGAWYVWAYYVPHDGPEPAPPPVPVESWSFVSPNKARSFGLPSVPSDGVMRYRSQWAWQVDDDSQYRYVRRGNKAGDDKIEISYPPKPEIGEAPK